jgi:hypothetical protein
MKRLIAGAFLLLCGAAAPGIAQTVDDLNIQIHGFATQGFLYTTSNNILTTTSSNGSPQWFESVINISAQPTPKLRIAVQGRYELLGSYANQISLDYAAADYKVNDFFGVRFGKVKTPLGLFNETQDIDPSYMWSLLPQGVYPIGSRNSVLSHFGGVVYGRIPLGQHLGKIEYRGFGGVRVLGSNDGYLISQTEAGLSFPDGLTIQFYGAALRWKTPLPGLILGLSDYRIQQMNVVLEAAGGELSGTNSVKPFNQPNYFGQYELGRWMVAAEWTRLPVTAKVSLNGFPAQVEGVDTRAWYAMASYKVTDKLSAGAYQSQSFDHRAALGPARYQKDWALSARYDFNQYVYAKAEQHFLNGTELSYDADLNQGGLKPTSKFTILKVGVSF